MTVLPTCHRRQGAGLWLLAAGIVVLVACGGGGNETTQTTGTAAQATSGRPLARVGDRDITSDDMRAYEARLLTKQKLPRISDHPDSVRHRLQTLVDREVMVLEAERHGLGRLDTVHRTVAEAARRRLIDRIAAEEVTGKITLDPEEIQRVYDDSEIGWELWLARIVNATEEDAREVLALLRDGAEFSTLARERSIADDAPGGGELRGFFGPEDMIPALRDGLFHLEEGELSEPINTIEGWIVLKVLIRKRLPLAQVRDEIVGTLRRREARALREQFVAELKERYSVQEVPAGIQAVVAQPGGAGLDPELPVIEYDGGSVTIGLTQRAIELHAGGRPPPTEEAVMPFLWRWVLADTLYVKLAQDRGHDQAPGFVAWRQEKRKALMVDELFRRQISSRFSVTQEDARRYYDEHLSTYGIPGDLTMTEVLVATREEAEEVLQLAKSGTPLEELSRERTIRLAAKHRVTGEGPAPVANPATGSHYHLDEDGNLVVPIAQGSPYHKIMDDESRREVGLIQGPMAVDDGWSVFRLEKPVVPYTLPFERIARHAVIRVRKQRERAIFPGYLDSLRAAYADRVEWLDPELAPRD